MTNKPRVWLTGKIAELAALLKRMPDDRQRAFSRDVLDEDGQRVQNEAGFPLVGEPCGGKFAAALERFGRYQRWNLSQYFYVKLARLRDAKVPAKKLVRQLERAGIVKGR